MVQTVCNQPPSKMTSIPDIAPMKLSLFKKKIIQQASHLYIGESAIHGRGVFSSNALRKGELIERAPLILIDNTENDLLKQTSLYHYYFVVGNAKTPVAIGLGYSSVYNHAGKANATYTINLPAQLVEIRATAAIAAGEEITINYNGKADDDSPVHFPINKI
jgi:SET domain-containing protein